MWIRPSESRRAVDFGGGVDGATDGDGIGAASLWSTEAEDVEVGASRWQADDTRQASNTAQRMPAG